MRALLQSQRAAVRFYRLFSRIYDSVNPLLYSGEMRRTLIDLVGAGGLALDVGIGSGYTSSELARRGFDVVGLDLSIDMLRRARAKLGSSAQLVRGDAASLPFKDACFDAVISAGLLEYVPCPRRALAEMVRVARSGARIASLVPRTPDCPLLRALGLLLALYRRRELAHLWEAAGLRSVRTVEVGPRRLMSKLAVAVVGTKP